MNHFSRASIVTPTALYVQICAAENQPARKQVRIKRAVRIPAMRGSEWGQVLRTLELTRACN
ncbi:Uncharacterised protein [Enterobacter hormaechei]|uniref:hypothetical protein n=1 Tax=Enterobacter hormaechei TaxID=158836 RepID=UPI000798CFD6|nr:hypothetical protein [Enterobacter hormaechei]SAG78143.1 Uncharacterised protein [Enterobacter hormaechei]